jgi:heat shock protein HslJ
MKTSTWVILICVAILAVLFLLFRSRGSQTSTPTSTPVPTNTPVPANTPVPSSTPEPANPPASSSIQNITWLWMSVTNKDSGAQTVVPEPAKYTIAFYPDNTLSVLADCNTISGTYSQDNGFSIKLGASTLMACGEGSLDQQYVQLLNNVAAGGPDGAGGLALETAGGQQRMLFSNGGPAPKP